MAVQLVRKKSFPKFSYLSTDLLLHEKNDPIDRRSQGQKFANDTYSTGICCARRYCNFYIFSPLPTSKRHERCAGMREGRGCFHLKFSLFFLFLFLFIFGYMQVSPLPSFCQVSQSPRKLKGHLIVLFSFSFRLDARHVD